MKKISLTLLLGILSAILVAGYTGYSFWQKASLDKEVNQVENQLSQYKNEALKYDNERVLEAIAAKKTLAIFEERTTYWSQIIREIRRTVPGDLVEIVSFSGTGGNAMNMNVKTIPGSEAPYLDVADLIQSFDESDNFDGTFVPSISAGEDTDGREVLTFALTVNYLDPEPEEKIGDALNDILDESLDIDSQIEDSEEEALLEEVTR